jgi:hypothetical protein
MEKDWGQVKLHAMAQSFRNHYADRHYCYYQAKVGNREKYMSKQKERGGCYFAVYPAELVCWHDGSEMGDAPGIPVWHLL